MKQASVLPRLLLLSLIQACGAEEIGLENSHEIDIGLDADDDVCIDDVSDDDAVSENQYVGDADDSEVYFVRDTVEAEPGLPMLTVVPVSFSDDGPTVKITRKKTKIRSRCRLFAPGVDVTEGTELTVVARCGAWVEVVRPDGNGTGFVHETDVAVRKPIRLSGVGVSEIYVACEDGTGRKG